MATYTITTTQNYTSLSGKGGGDTLNVNGGTLVIDCDTRYGVNATTSTGVIGNVNLSSTLGGDMQILGTNIWAFRIGALSAGVVPAVGSTITQGGVTAEFICVMSNHYGGTITTSGTLTAGTWIKVRGMTGGAFTTGTATSGASVFGIDVAPVRSFIEVCGVEALSLTVNRLNSLTVNGDWWTCLDSNGNPQLTGGVRGETFQLPYTASGFFEYGGIEVETGPGTGIYEHWLNTCYKFSSTNHSTDNRCKFVRIDSSGLVTFGQDSGAAYAGFMPPTGCRVRIPNIITTNANAASGYANNVRPSGTIGTRYETATSSSGVVSIQRMTGAWYINLQQAYSVFIRDLHTCEQFVISETSTPPDINGILVGMSNQTVAYASNAIVFQQCLNGGTAKNLTCVRSEQVSTAGYACYFVNLYGGWVIDNVRSAFASVATALAGPIFFNTCDSLTVTNLYLIGKRLIMSACTNWSVTNVYYADNPVGTTAATVSTQAIELMAGCKNAILTNIANWPGAANVHALGGLVYMNTCFDILVTGIGSSSTPYDAGTISAQRSGYMFADGGLNKNIKFQRNWLTNLRIGLASSTNTSQSIKMQNCYNTDATLTQGPNWFNSTVSGNRQNSGTVPTSYTHVDGMHFYDAFTSDTAARAFLVFTEKTTSTSSAYTINSGTPKFTSTGTVVMRTVGDSITWTWSYFMFGWTGLSTYAVTGTNSATNYLYEYDLDKGNGFSGTWKTVTNANLAAETGINPTTGVKPRIRITCTVGNSTNTLTSFVINGTTTLANQNAALYPLDGTGLTFSGVQPGSDVIVYAAGTTNVISTADSITGSTYTYSYAITQPVDVGFFLSGYRPQFIRNYQLTTTPTTIPVSQEVDRSYV